MQSQKENIKIAIIGCGNMGAAIAQRLSKHSTTILFDRNPEKVQKLAHLGYGKVSSSLEEAIEKADFVLLAIKPQNIEACASMINENIKNHQILISLLAATPLKKLKELFFNASKIVRMMPNLAIKVGEGVAALCIDSEEPQEFKNKILDIFSSMGLVFWIDENKIDAISSLAGSGPAFIFTFIEAMIEASIAMGLPAKDALPLVLQTMQGSIALLQKSDVAVSTAKWQVTSPGGTTIAGLRQLEKSNVRSGIIETFIATFEKNKQIA